MNSISPRGALRPLSVVVGLAFTDADGPAFDMAAHIAERAPRSKLHLAHAFPKGAKVEQMREIADHLSLYVDEKAARRGGFKATDIRIHVRIGKPVRELVQLVTDLHADLLVLGSREGRHLKSWFVGSIADRLVTASPCPVLVAAPHPKPDPSRAPAIEPPCPDCIRVRSMTKGASFWCKRHSHRPRRAHVYSYRRELPFGSHDSEAIPTGIKF